MDGIIAVSDVRKDEWDKVWQQDAIWWFLALGVAEGESESAKYLLMPKVMLNICEKPMNTTILYTIKNTWIHSAVPSIVINE